MPRGPWSPAAREPVACIPTPVQREVAARCAASRDDDDLPLTESDGPRGSAVPRRAGSGPDGHRIASAALSVSRLCGGAGKPHRRLIDIRGRMPRGRLSITTPTGARELSIAPEKLLS